MRLKILEKEQSPESLVVGVIGATGTKNAIETLEEGTKSRKPCDWLDWCNLSEKCHYISLRRNNV